MHVYCMSLCVSQFAVAMILSSLYLIINEIGGLVVLPKVFQCTLRFVLLVSL